MNKFLLVIALVTSLALGLASPVAAQPVPGGGPGPIPDPWVVIGNTISFPGEFLATPSQVGTAGLNLGVGACPTAPVNGDFCETATGAYFYINSIWVALVSAASSPSNQFMTGINTQGQPQFAQPSFSNLSGSATTAQLPTGTSGATVPLNNGGFTQSSTVNFTGTFEIGGNAMTFPSAPAMMVSEGMFGANTWAAAANPLNATGGLVGYGGAMGNVTGHASLDLLLTGGTLSGSLAIGAGSGITSSGPGGALGSNAFNSTAYLPLTGGTMAGNIVMGNYGIVSDLLYFDQLTSGASAGPTFVMNNTNGGNGAGGGIDFNANNSSAVNKTAAYINGGFVVSTAGAEQGLIDFEVYEGATLTNRIVTETCTGTYCVFDPSVDNYWSLGLVSYAWSNVVTHGLDVINGHILATSTSPSISACGTGSPAVAGSDNFGTITTGGGTLTSCVINFGHSWGTAPACTVSFSASTLAVTVARSTTQLTIGATSLTAETIFYHCGSVSQLEPANDNFTELRKAA